MTIGTEPLTPEATWRELDMLIGFMQSLGIEQVAVTYGWGCRAEGIEQPVAVPLDELVSLLQKSIAQGIYHLGEDNLDIEASDPSLQITLCHEADIHFKAADQTLEARLRSEWQDRGVRVWPASK